MKPLLIQSIEGLTIERPPVWCMRQAGRYLPEYQELRRKYSFNQLAETPHLAKEITLQPLRRFKQLDAAILFADILTPSRALGFDFEFEPGPKLKNPITCPDDIDAIKKKSVDDAVPFVFEALKEIRMELDNEDLETRRALLGFAASPWTLACYLIDQGIYKQHMGTKIFARKYPDHFAVLCELISDITIQYLNRKIESGADAVQIFDTWGNLLSLEEYHYFSGQWIEKIIKAVKSNGAKVILYVQANRDILRKTSDYEPDVLSIDWRTALHELENELPDSISLQGNIDPTFLFDNPESISTKTHQIYNSIKRRSRIIANVGHGLLPATPIEGVQAFLSGVHSSWANSSAAHLSGDAR